MTEKKGVENMFTAEEIAEIKEGDSVTKLARKILSTKSTITSAERWETIELIRNKSLVFAKHEIADYKKLATGLNLEKLGKIAALFPEKGDNSEDGSRTLEEFQRKIVPQIKYELGDFEFIQSSFKKARLQQKNALWNSLKFKDAGLLEKLLHNLDASINNQPTFSCVFTVGPTWTGRKALLESYYPQYKKYETPNLPYEQLSPHARGLHLRQIKHYLSVYGRAGKPVLISGNNQSPILREQMVEFARSLGAHITLLFFDLSFEKVLDGIEGEDERKAAIQSYESLKFPHPWEGHKIEVFS